MDNDALVSGAAALAIALFYGLLGWRLSQRRVSSEARIPAAQFGLFWMGLAAVTLISGVESLVAAFYLPPLSAVPTHSVGQLHARALGERLALASDPEQRLPWIGCAGRHLEIEMVVHINQPRSPLRPLQIARRPV